MIYSFSLLVLIGWFPWKWKPTDPVKQHKAEDHVSTSIWDQYLTDPSPTTDPENITTSIESDVPATSDPTEIGMCKKFG